MTRDEILDRLAETDLQLARSLEDLLTALKRAGHVRRSDIPEAVWDRLEERKRLRDKLR